MVHAAVRLLGDYWLVIQRPASQYRIKQADQLLLFHRFVSADDLLYLPVERFHVLFGRFDQEFPAVFAEIPTKEVETFIYVDDMGFLERQLQSSNREKLLNPRLDFIFEHFFRAACNHKIIRISHHVDF